MQMLPFLVLPLAAMALGLVLLVIRLRGMRKPLLVGLHLLLGLGALELLVVLLKGSPGLPAGDFGNVAAGFLALAAFIGLLTQILGRRSRLTANAMLLAHGSAGLAGVLLCIAWASSL
jgi:hypothetical protein